MAGPGTIVLYPTRVAALNLLFGGLTRPGRLRYELTWLLEPEPEPEIPVVEGARR